MQRSIRGAVWIAVASVGAASGCTSRDPGTGTTSRSGIYPTNCTASCLACGGDDGCGGVCGCTGTDKCSSTGKCVAQSSCTETCQTAGWTCGSLCEAQCGTCGVDQGCVQGTCLAARDISCPTCPLQLTVANRTLDASGALDTVTLSLVYAPAAGAARGRIADFRVQADRAVTLVGADLGAALTSTGKELFLDPTSQNPWQRPSEGLHQLLVVSRADTRRIEAGELLRLRFKLEVPVGIASFRLVRRDEVFAPADANAVVQASGYDAPVVVR